MSSCYLQNEEMFNRFCHLGLRITTFDSLPNSLESTIFSPTMEMRHWLMQPIHALLICSNTQTFWFNEKDISFFGNGALVPIYNFGWSDRLLTEKSFFSSQIGRLQKDEHDGDYWIKCKDKRKNKLNIRYDILMDHHSKLKLQDGMKIHILITNGISKFPRSVKQCEAIFC